MAKTYLVGGAVRDKLLGLIPKESDWVVVGSSADDLVEQGFKPVGKDFPVFLHPKTKEEYALARTERKTKPGYTGFEFHASPDVTLEEDLMRRDLTINAIAEDESGVLIDPYNGAQDIEQKILRHVSSAFVEDPVRILRIARFAARFAHLGFIVAADTNKLMQQMVQEGEVNALVAERVWKEMSRALATTTPVEFFKVLQACNALSVLFPMLTEHFSPFCEILQAVSQHTSIMKYRFAAMLSVLSEDEIKAFCTRNAVPNELRQLALLVQANQNIEPQNLSAEQKLQLLQTSDAFRRAERFQDMLNTLSAMHNKPQSYGSLLQALKVCQNVSAEQFVKAGYKGAELGEKIEQARLEAIKYES